jgi:hypothetical protein
MRFVLSSCSACLVLLWLVAPADATTVLPADFAAMVRTSRVIVHGVVREIRPQLAGPRRIIERVITVDVIDPIKGAAASTVRFRVPGGQIGRYRRVMVGAPEFTEGDEVVLFLSGQPPAVPMPFGLNQGVYRVTRGGGAATVAPVITEGAGRIVRGDPARRPLRIDAFTQQVRAVMGQP